jgi:hypothetical protein
MSFGFTNALAHFMYLMNSVFMAKLEKFSMVFNDDNLVYSKSKKEHEWHLCIMLYDCMIINSMLSTTSMSSDWVKYHSCVTWYLQREYLWIPARCRMRYTRSLQGLSIRSVVSSDWLVITEDSS